MKIPLSDSRQPEAQADQSVNTTPEAHATPPLVRPSTCDIPERLGRYRIIRLLGRGGMGAVYLAEDTQLERQVALKVPHFAANEHTNVLERFYREARTAARLHHPNICPVFDVNSIDDAYYLTMAYIDGQTLSELVPTVTAAPARDAAVLVAKLARALDEAHRQGITHRD